MSGDPKGGSNSDEAMWVGAFILCCIIIGGLWFFAREIIVWMILGIDIAQFYLLSVFMKFGEQGNNLFEFTKAVFDGRKNPAEVRWEELMIITKSVGGSMKIPLAILLFVMSGYTYKYMKGGGYARTFSLAGGKGKGASLAHYQTQQWGVAITSAQFNPNTKEPNLLPAKTPMEWMRDNGISLSEKAGMDRDAAEAAFELQLGDKWPGLDNAPIHIKVFVILCALSAKRDKNKDQIKGEIAKIWTMDRKHAASRSKKIIAPYLKDPVIRKTIDKYMSRHHYTTTAIYRLLSWARKKGGVFACAEFLWLKNVDRNLWYALQNVGRRAYHTEGAGVVSHYQVEFLTGKAVAAPHVMSAVDGLEHYLQHNHVTNLEDVFREDDDFK